MSLKINYTKLVLAAGLLFLCCNSFASGIVLANEARETRLFNSEPSRIIAFADSLSTKYNRVILHLGRSYVFRSGNIFTSEKSRKNLKLFADELQLKGATLSLWFFDSFGKEAFEKLEAEYKEICNENLHVLDTLKVPYKGIAIDMEWINLNNAHNNEKLEETVAYIRKKLGKEKKLYFFAAIHENSQENSKRGYNLDQLLRQADTPLAMLYPAESGFHMVKKNIVPDLNNDRINSLKHFYKKEKFEVAVSFADKWMCQMHHDLSELEILKSQPAFTESQLKLKDKVKKGYWNQESYAVVGQLTVDLEKGHKMMLHPGDIVTHFTIDQTLAEPDYFIWENDDSGLN